MLQSALIVHPSKKQLAAIRKEEDAMLKKLGIDIPDEHADHKEQGLDAKK